MCHFLTALSVVTPHLPPHTQLCTSDYFDPCLFPLFYCVFCCEFYFLEVFLSILWLNPPLHWLTHPAPCLVRRLFGESRLLSLWCYMECDGGVHSFSVIHIYSCVSAGCGIAAWCGRYLLPRLVALGIIRPRAVGVGVWGSLIQYYCIFFLSPVWVVPACDLDVALSWRS